MSADVQVTPEGLATFIRFHPPAACVDVAPDFLTVCCHWFQRKRIGWRTERIPATQEAVRAWLGY